jgi:hypothetical protein
MDVLTLVVTILAVVCALLAANETGAEISTLSYTVILVTIGLVALILSLRNTTFGLYLGRGTSSSSSQPSQQSVHKITHKVLMFSLRFDFICAVWLPNYVE